VDFFLEVNKIPILYCSCYCLLTSSHTCVTRDILFHFWMAYWIEVDGTGKYTRFEVTLT